MAGNNPTAARRSSYAEKLKDPRWQKKRLEVLQRDEWKCVYCGADDKTLHVHHLMYWPGRDPWDYRNEFLQSLCYECHENTRVEPDGLDPENAGGNMYAEETWVLVNATMELAGWKYLLDVAAALDKLARRGEIHPLGFVRGLEDDRVIGLMRDLSPAKKVI